MEKLLRDIDTDTASITLSQTSSSSSTLVASTFGVKSASLKRAVEKLALQGIEGVKVRSKLRKISEHLQQEEDYIPPQFYDELLELQRVGIHLNGVRNKAWDLLLLLMERRRTERMVDVILQWPSIETQLFLCHLSVLKLSGWYETLHPTRLSKIVTSPSTSSSSRDAAMAANPEHRNECLLHSYRNIIGSVLKLDPSTLHAVFDVNGFLLMQTKGPITNKDAEDTTVLLSRFFHQLSLQFDASHSKTDVDKWELPLSANDFCRFLTTGPPDQLLLVVDHIMEALHSSVSYKSASHELLELHTREEIYTPPEHATLCLLWVSMHLCLQSQIASKMFADTSILELLSKLWLDDSLPAGTPQMDTFEIKDHSSRGHIHLACCITMAALSIHRVVCPSLVTHLKTHYPEFFTRVFPVFTAEYSTINHLRRSKCDQPSPDDRAEFFEAIFDIVSSQPQVHPETVVKRAWAGILLQMKHESEGCLVSTLLHMSRSQAQFVLRQIVTMRMSGWNESCFLKEMPSNLTSAQWSKSLRQIVKEIYRNNPSLLHSSVDVRSSSIIQTDYSPNFNLELKDALGVFFDTLDNPELVEHGDCRLPTDTRFFVEYLTTVSLENLQIVIDHVSSALSVLSRRNPGVLSSDVPASNANCIPSLNPRNHFPHPTLPYLHFAIFLAYSSEQASHLFLRGGITEILGHFFTQDLHDLLLKSSENRVMNENILRLRCLMMLGAISKDHHRILLADLQNQLKQRPYHWLGSGSMPLDIVNVGLCLQTGEDSFFDMSGLVESIMIFTGRTRFKVFSIPGGPDIHGRHPWHQLISTLSCSVESNNAKMDCAEQILYFCTITPEKGWSPLLDVILESSLFIVPIYIMNEYLGFNKERQYYFEIPDRTAISLGRMCRKAEECGFEIVNPIDRFVILMSRVATCGRPGSRALEGASLFAFLREVSMGTYDLSGMPTPTQTQADVRRRECDWLRSYVTMELQYEGYDD